MDNRIEKLTEWQRAVYKLCWDVGASKDVEAGKKLDLMKRERPKEYEEAFKVWQQIMFEVLY